MAIYTYFYGPGDLTGEITMNNKIIYGLIALSLCFISVNSYARIKLITLPVREHIEIHLENENVSLIEEERIVPLQKGHNNIDFSWHNTSIQADTIIFRVIDEVDQPNTNILSVSYPPNESALTWAVSSDRDGSARVSISYVINHLHKKYHYLAATNADETQMNLKQYIQIINQSGEQYREAVMNTGTANSHMLSLGLNETQEFLNHDYAAIPVNKIYTVNAAELGYRDRSQDKLNVLMHYQLHNDVEHNMGIQPLAPGKVRIYQRDKQGRQVFMGEDWGQYTARGNKEQLYIGQARDIVVKRIIERKNQQHINGNLKDIDILVKYEIENFKEEAVTLIIEESLIHLRNEVLPQRSQHPKIEWLIGGDTNFDNTPLKERTNSQNIAYAVSLPGRKVSEQGEMESVLKLEKKLNINLKNEW